MSAPACDREMDVVRAVLSRHWPHPACRNGLAPFFGRDAALRAHVDRCAACADVAAVTALLTGERDAAIAHAHVPAAGQVWWRAAVRARLDAVEKAATPLTWLQGLVGAGAAGLSIALLGIVWPTVKGGLGWIAERASAYQPPTADVMALMPALQRSLPLFLLLALCLVLAPIVFFLVVSED